MNNKVRRKLQHYGMRDLIILLLQRMQQLQKAVYQIRRMQQNDLLLRGHDVLHMQAACRKL